jgi:hypothetical protein
MSPQVGVGCSGRNGRYRGYSKVGTHTALGHYGRSIPRSRGLSWGRRVSLNSSNPCREFIDYETSMITDEIV